MKIAFRTDSSTRLGSGHLMRCLTLATTCARLGAEVHFYCAELPGNLLDRVEASGFSLRRLVPDEGKTDDFLAAEIAAFREALGPSPSLYDWIVVDNYELDERWEKAARAVCRRILVIDDLADRPHSADILLDQNVVADAEHRYDTLVDASCRRLIGPRYALLHDAFRRPPEPARSPDDGCILVYFGAADLHGLTLQALRALLALNVPNPLEVVIGPLTPDAGEVLALASGRPNVRVHSLLPTLAPLLARSRLAIGGSGATNWERIRFAIPTITVVLADNQRPIDNELARRDVVSSLGEARHVTAARMLERIGEVLAGEVRFLGLPSLAQTIDGWGAQRVACAMVEHDPTFDLRAADRTDELLLLEWANDLETRQNSLNTKPISPDDHRKWFAGRLASPENCRIFVAEDSAGVPLGYVRFERRDEVWSISYALDRAFRGRGLGRPLLAAATVRLSADAGDVALRAEVKPQNLVSRRIFEQLAFRLTEDRNDALVFSARTNDIRIMGNRHV